MMKSETMSSAEESSDQESTPIKSGSWLVPGDKSWEIRDPDSVAESVLRTVDDSEGTRPPTGIALVALPATLVTCQLFWLETTDEKAVPDLIRMQCERRALLRQNEIWKSHILRQEEGRLLVQVLILQNALPGILEVESEARFEALPRCLALPTRSACLWKSLETIVLTITGDAGVLYFQSLPHHSLTRECRRDVQSVLWIAMAHRWLESVDMVVLLGPWMAEDARELESMGYSVTMQETLPLSSPSESMELVPKNVRHLRRKRRRRVRTLLAASIVALVYLAFLSLQLVDAVMVTASNRYLQSDLDSKVPEMTDLQNIARRMDALNPALDTKTYPLEILHRIMATLPESGVRLTRYEIINNRVEVTGEASSTREAFDFLQAIQSAGTLDYVEWENPPQPVPLPNDTARFLIRGTITGAYHHVEES